MTDEYWYCIKLGVHSAEVLNSLAASSLPAIHHTTPIPSDQVPMHPTLPLECVILLHKVKIPVARKQQRAFPAAAIINSTAFLSLFLRCTGPSEAPFHDLQIVNLS